MILTFYRFLPLGNAILSNLAKNTGSSDVKGTGRSEMTEVTPGGGTAIYGLYGYVPL